MATLFVRHKVEDFGAWKAAYDAFDAERKTMGVTAHGVFQTEDNPNEVTLYHEFENMDAAKTFVGSARLKEVMESAGVVGPPDMWFTKKA
jgi:quinol monooxygenase YgiN